jgi:hypothetical protein
MIFLINDKFKHSNSDSSTLLTENKMTVNAKNRFELHLVRDLPRQLDTR